MKSELIILDEDKAYMRTRIAELEAAIQALGPEFYEVFNQSSETWHDNAPFDALRDRQSLLDAELQNLRRILRESMPKVPSQVRDRVGIGAVVRLSDGRAYFIAGDWTPYAGAQRNDAIVMSRQAPLATRLIGKKVGDSVLIGKQTHQIMTILYL